MVMNRSRVALAMSVALLALWAAPAEAQRGAKKAGVQKPLKKPLGSKQRPRGKQQPRGEQPADPIEQLAAEPAPAPESLSTAQPSPAPAAQPQPAAPRPSSATSEAERPWAKGVSKEQQEAALTLFREANALVKESIFVQANEKYRKALALWDHPAIHYNLALALMNLDQPVEVHEHLVAALRFGPDPLEAEKFEYARNYKVLVEKQLARVDISCDTPGTTVTLDGNTLFVAPGRYSGLVRPGAHSIVATKEGYLPTDQSRTLLPGETTALDLKMFTSDDLIQYRRKWPAAVPWLVVGAGVAVGAGSGWFHFQARNNFRTLDTGVTDCGGCFLTPALDTNLNRARNYQTLAIGGYAVGGAALLTGAVLVYLNQPQPFRVDPTQKTVELVSVAPLVGGGTGGLLTTFRF